jgi:hypothetical protein
MDRSKVTRHVSDHATIEILTSTGYQVVHNGDNGFVCIVMRGFTGAPTFTPVALRGMVYDAKTRAPICLNPQAVQTVLPNYQLQTNLGLDGKSPEQIALTVQAAYANGRIPKRASSSFGYMWSADQILGPAGHWHPPLIGLRTWLRKPDARQQPIWRKPAGSRRRCGNPFCRSRHPGRRVPCNQGKTLGPAIGTFCQV